MKNSIRKCVVCGKEYLPKSGNSCLCPKNHVIICSYCGKEIYLKGIGQIRYTIERKRYQLPFHIIENTENKCIITFIEFGCKKCNLTIQKIRRAQNNMDKYGVPNTSMLPEVKKKISRSVSSKEVQDKIRENSMNKYGVDRYTKDNDYREKLSKINSSKGVRDKTINTNLKIYNHEHPMQNEDIKNKRIKTCNNIYGVNNVLESEAIREKIKMTCLEKYNSEHYIGSETFRNTYLSSAILKAHSKESIQSKKENYLVNHGVNWPTKNDAVKTKIIATNIERYGVKTPGLLYGWKYSYHVIYKCREKECLLRSIWELVYAEYLRLNNIQYEYESLNIKYIFDNKEHTYIPDFYIPLENKIVEIKGFIDHESEPIVIAKKEASINLGYNYLLITDIKEISEFVEMNILNFNEIIFEIKKFKNSFNKTYIYDVDNIVNNAYLI